METVKESKLKLHSTFNDSESIHLNSFMDTGALFMPTSKKDKIESIAVITTNEHVIR